MPSIIIFYSLLNTKQMLVVENLEIVKVPVKGDEFPWGYVTKKGFDFDTPVRVVCIFPGIGDVASVCSIESLLNRGFFYAGPQEYSLFASTGVYDIVYMLVQTVNGDSCYQRGEIDFIVKKALEVFNCKEIEAIGISLGGLGLLRGINTIERAKYFKHVLFDMPGGNGYAGEQFPALAVQAGMETMFCHAIDDKTALPIQSSKIDGEITRLGGRSQFVLYKTGAHSIMTRPFGAWYNVQIKQSTGKILNPWKMAYKVESGDYAVMPESDVPALSLYEWFMSSVPVPDKLLLKQEVWQRADGIIYTKTIQ
jgi:hypothetical protein